MFGYDFRKGQLIGSIRRECLDHLAIVSEAQLRGILRTYACYYKDQNASVIEQRCARLSSSPARQGHRITRGPRRASSPLCADLGFRYTQVVG